MTINSSPNAPHQGQLRLIASEWRNHWRAGLGAIIGGALGYTIWQGVSSLFVIPLQEEFGWSRGDIAAANYAGLVTAFVAPLLGRLVDRYSAKPALTIGLALVALGYAAMSQLNGSLSVYYLVYFLLQMCGMATTGITVTRRISGFFVRTRGTALAIVRSTLGVATALVPLLLSAVIADYGWRGGFLTLSALSLFVALPAVYFLVPNKEVADDTNLIVPKRVHSKWITLLSQRKVLIICLASALNYAPVGAAVSQLQPIGIGYGLDPVTAAGGLAILGIAVASGALLSGLLVDRFWAPAVAFALNMLAGAGCLALVLSGQGLSPITFYIAAFLIGVGQGAEIDIVAFMIARYFGLGDYSTIYGMSVTCIAISAALSVSLIGKAYDVFGNYDLAIFLCAASFASAAVLYLAMGRYPAAAADA